MIFTEEVNGKLNLIIDYLEKENAGIYSCYAINSEESGKCWLEAQLQALKAGETYLAERVMRLLVSANVELIYTEAPTVTAKENNMMVKVGVSAVLRCVATGEPKPVLKWYKSGVEITSNSRFQVSV